MTVACEPCVELLTKIRARTAKVGIVGCGYVGLPLAVEFAQSGFSVVGFDVDAGKVSLLNQGESYNPDVPVSQVSALVMAGRLRASCDFSLLAECDAVGICVPTPLRKTKDPDVSFIVAAVEHVACYLRKGQLIILESTTYPGTTEELVLPMLEAGGMKVGQDFHLAFSPERVDPGNKQFAMRNTPKVVGGITAACTEAAVSLYAQAIESVIPVSSTRVAEMVKLLENTFRSVNIGLVNEIALMCRTLGIDVWEVIQAAASKPFGFMPFYPGPGLGGHCIPIDPFYLSWKARQNGFEARFIELAGQINGKMPHHVVSRIADALNDQGKALRGARVLVLGVAYKRDVDDLRESPALDVMIVLRAKGAKLAYHDPLIPALRLGEEWMRSVGLEEGEASRYDCVVIITDHSVLDYARVVREAPVIVDARNAIRSRGLDHPALYGL